MEFARRHRPAEPIRASHGGDPADAFHLVVPSIPGLRVLRPAQRDRAGSVGRIAAGVRGADAPPRLRPLRRAGRRLGLRDLARAWPRRPASTSSACTLTRSMLTPSGRVTLTASGRRRRRSSAGSTQLERLPARADGLRADPVDPAPDPRLRADRLAGRPARLDRREVQGVDRPAASCPRTASTATSC